MRLICPNCDAQYEVDDAAIPFEGRDVQCSNCGHAWFQLHPEVEAAQEAEAALFEPPESEPLPEDTELPDDTVPPDAFEPEDFEPEAIEEVQPAPRRGVDENLMAVLREEAEREVQARRAEAPRGIETQEELGLDSASAATAVSPAARRIAALKGIDPDAELAVQDRRTTRSELLPDIEEINSTLRPSAGRIDIGGEAAPQTKTSGGSAFRSGFVLMVFLAVVAMLVYVMAPRIAEQIPAAAGAMEAYVAGVDALRIKLDALMQRAVLALQGNGA